MSGLRPSSVFDELGPGDADTAVSVIVKITGETCNINCFYCYEKRKPYPQKNFLAAENLRTFLNSIGPRPIALELHGGEPLLIGKDRLTELLKVIADFPNVVRLSLQTNATLLDDEWLGIFRSARPRLQLGLSVDGDHKGNAFRLDYKGRSTIDAVISALDLCEARRQPCGVIVVVNKANCSGASEVLDFLSRWTVIKTVSLVPCFDFQTLPKQIPKAQRAAVEALAASAAEGAPGWAVTPEEYGAFVIQACDHWLSSHHYGQYLLEPVMSVVRKIEGRHTTSCHFTSLKCAHVLTLYPDGRVGVCDELPMPAGLLASSDKGFQVDVDTLSEAETRLPLFRRFESLIAKCQKCSYLKICGGGCFATRLRYEGTNLDDAYCGYRIRLIEHVRKTMTRAMSTT